MEQESSNDKLDTDGPVSASDHAPEEPSAVFVSDDLPQAPAAVTGHSTIDTEPTVPEHDVKPVSEPVSTEVVDPYTAAPPPHFFLDDTPDPSRPAESGPYGREEPFGSDPVVSDPFVPLPYAPVSSGEAIRRSGLAWSAGVAFFGSVAFTLFLGWLADLLLGTSPWGIVGGIVLGSIIGFLQFFRITSRIFPAKGDTPAVSPLMSSQDDDNV